MKLLDLPPELLRKILQQTVVTLGLCHGIKLRLVCSKWPQRYLLHCKSSLTRIGSFDSEVPNAFSATRLLEMDPPDPVVPVNCVNAPLLSKYVFDRTMTDHTGRDNLRALIHDTVDSMLRLDQVETNEQAAKLRRDYTRSLCEVAATASIWTFGRMGTFLHLRSLLEHILVAAAYFGKVELVTRLIEKGTVDINGKTYFDTALPVRC